MAVRIATANGNLTAAGTWATVDATSLLDSEAASTALTTAYVESAAFTPGAITIDGLAVKVAARTGTTGTFDVRLAQAGATVAGTQVSINVSDVQARDGEQGWYFFKFAAPVTLLAATAYTLSAKTTSAAQVNLYRNATAGNWSRLLRTTTTGAPAAGDSMHVLGEWTAAATMTARTVTMDSTAATDYGDGVSANPPGFTIGTGGTVTWGATAATAYILQVSTRLAVYRGGTMNMGTTGTPCPRDSTMVLQFDCVADGDFGLLIYGTFNGQGQSRSSGKLVEQCLMNADKAAAATTINVDADTGWLNGDDVAIAPTARTSSQGELRTLSGAAGASSFAITAGLTNAHSGTSPTQGEVILLTRAVRIRSVSTTAMAYVNAAAGAVLAFAWVEFRYHGTSTTNKRGVECDTTVAGGGSANFSYCSFRDFEFGGLWFGNADADNIVVSHCVGWNLAQGNTEKAFYVNSSNQTATNWSVRFLTLINCGAFNGFGFSVASIAGTVGDIRVSGSSEAGINVAPLNTVYGRQSPANPWTNINVHANSANGIEVQYVDELTIVGFTGWRNGNHAIALVDQTASLKITTGTIFGNATAGMKYGLSSGGANGFKRFVAQSVTFAGDTSFAQPSGVLFYTNVTVPQVLELDNCTLGVASGIFVAHSSGDIDIGATAFRIAQITLRNTNLASATPIANSAQMRPPSFVKYQRVNQATNVHKAFYPVRGTVSYETTTFKTAAPSQKLVPVSSLLKLESGPKREKVASAATVSVSVWVRKDATYNGNAPRLMQRANAAIGVLVDTVLATHSAAADTWQQLSGATAAASENGVGEFFVDCDGTAGAVYVDDWSAS